ncbi:hypothetical protein CC1G_01230 [Coprinopsis cinerea okayama7|uniref:Hydrophobin n=1 Tax=Coprinopsis cinerea (strain Okayama-7 / 130 / ATCC MYA-4618 / FGSC 9003) TaxID=240176 RepID=A8NEZ0_COPC7|nr:hypothetical protein CC1G_01230 [Coprinopsis cinerea okayama7\|eukprot:XP_001833168.1 hypothetical protein CC1G_01230 [Coprinopsis cinerea okayama7\
MFARFNAGLLAVALALPAVVSATPVVARTENACNTGSLHCCESTFSSNHPSVSTLAGLFGFVGNLGNSIGISCSALNIGSLGGAPNCNQQTVCCTGNQYNGLIAFGCTPFNFGF